MTKVLIVEDDLMIADMTEDVLREHGYEVSGIARTVEQAVALARLHQPHLIVLDLRLANGGLGTEVAAQLEPGILPGILYATGNISQVNLSTADGHACIAKPYRPQDLIRGLELVASILDHGTAEPPFPSGFQLLQPVPRHSASYGA
ncbi:MAG: response regulator [Sphingomonadales bacterium]|nr:response regulator [Sphingomonadales bacterium]